MFARNKDQESTKRQSKKQSIMSFALQAGFAVAWVISCKTKQVALFDASGSGWDREHLHKFKKFEHEMRLVWEKILRWTWVAIKSFTN